MRVRRATLHHTSDEEGPAVYSEAVLPIDQDVSDFIVKHVEKSLKSTQIRQGVFKFPEPGAERIAGWCVKAMSARDEGFVRYSAKIAEQLNTCVESSKAISSGILVVALVEQEGDSFLALLKLEPGLGYQWVEEKKNGTKLLSINVDSEYLPSPKEQLQKCAFVWPKLVDGHQLLLLDRQTRTLDGVTDWFLSDFLESDLARDDAELTKRFNKALNSTISRIGEEDPESASRLRTARAAQLNGALIDADAMVEQLGLPDPSEQVLEAELQSKLGEDRRFGVDEQTRSKIQRRVKFKGDGGLILTAKPEDYEAMVSETGPVNGYMTITIKTRKWTPAS